MHSHRHFGILLFLSLASLFAATEEAQPPRSQAAEALLQASAKEFDSSCESFFQKYRTEAITAQLCILESRSNVEGALARANRIKDPFYSSLALGGIAAALIPIDVGLSEKTYRDALRRTSDIKQWTGSDATSLACLIQLIPAYPAQTGITLLGEAEKALDAWQASEYQKGPSLLALSEAAIVLKPEMVHSLLYDKALKSNHYFASTERLAQFLAQQSPDDALRAATELYNSKEFGLEKGDFLRAVLIEISKHDFKRAFEGIKTMRGIEREVAAVKLAQALMTQQKTLEAAQVVDYAQSLELRVNWSKTALDDLQRQLKEPPRREQAPTSPEIATFLNEPDARTLESLASAETVSFKSREQVLRFAEVAGPIADAIQDGGYPHHGSPHSATLGLIVIGAAKAGDVDRSLKTAAKIRIPELRVYYLLQACTQVQPMPIALRNWPILFWRSPLIKIEQP